MINYFPVPWLLEVEKDIFQFIDRHDKVVVFRKSVFVLPMVLEDTYKTSGKFPLKEIAFIY